MKGKHNLTSQEKLKKWSYGEWIEEPDELEWKYKEVACRIVRNNWGALCGYISVPPGHSWFEKDYDDIESDVHGGLTFSGMFDNGEFWIGYDCAHYDDISPGLEIIRESVYEKLPELQNLYSKIKESYSQKTYKNIAFCKQECENLVDQMLEAKNVNST